MSLVAKRLAELGVTLPQPAAPVANYVAFARVGALLFVSGQLPLGPDGKIAPAHIGKLGPRFVDRSGAARRRGAARSTCIAQAQAAIGDLDRIAQVVRLGGFFNVDGRFDALPQAMNGASDLMAAAFGPRGRHARTTVGVSHLPLGALAEIEATVRDRRVSADAPAWLDRAADRPSRPARRRQGRRREHARRGARRRSRGGFAIECDVQLSRDGEAMVFHDDSARPADAAARRGEPEERRRNPGARRFATAASAFRRCRSCSPASPAARR